MKVATNGLIMRRTDASDLAALNITAALGATFKVIAILLCLGIGMLVLGGVFLAGLVRASNKGRRLW